MTRTELMQVLLVFKECCDVNIFIELKDFAFFENRI